MKAFGFDFGDELKAEHFAEEESEIEEVKATFRPSSQREFDAGVVADLHCEHGEKAAQKLGIEYIPGVGPVLKNEKDARNFCEETGQMPSRLVHIERRPVRGRNLFGHQSKKTRKCVVVEDWDDAAIRGNQRRSDAEVRADAKRYAREKRIEDAERRRMEQSKMKRTFFSFPKS